MILCDSDHHFSDAYGTTTLPYSILTVETDARGYRSDSADVLTLIIGVMRIFCFSLYVNVNFITFLLKLQNYTNSIKNYIISKK